MATTKNLLIETGPGGRGLKVRGLEVKGQTIVISAISYSSLVLDDVSLGKAKLLSLTVGDTVSYKDLMYMCIQNISKGCIIKDYSDIEDGEAREYRATPEIEAEFKQRDEELSYAFRLRTEPGFASDVAKDKVEQLEEARATREVRSKAMSALLEKELLAKAIDEATEAHTEAVHVFDDYKQKATAKMADLDKTFAELKAKMDTDGIDFIDIQSPGEPLPPRVDKGDKGEKTAEAAE
jgi:hypothetical protein